MRKDDAVRLQHIRQTRKRKATLTFSSGYEPPSTFFEFIDLEDHLCKLLGVRVDLVMKSGAKNLAFGDAILPELEKV